MPPPDPPLDAPPAIDRVLTAQQVARIQTWSIDVLLDELVADATRWCIGDCAMDERAVTVAIEQRLEALGIARKVHAQGCTGAGGYFRTCACRWITPS